TPPIPAMTSPSPAAAAAAAGAAAGAAADAACELPAAGAAMVAAGVDDGTGWPEVTSSTLTSYSRPFTVTLNCLGISSSCYLLLRPALCPGV
ncbi:MAG TPA: hypothetical protein DHV85_20755, partial [Candidatus Accumulibacter sp.]|nr:hypothetical protein [Accumulibacter sp.]